MLNAEKSIRTSTIPNTIIWQNITLNDKHLFNAIYTVFDYIVFVEIAMTALSTERMSTSAVLLESTRMIAENTTAQPTFTSFVLATSGLTTMSANATTLKTTASLPTATGTATTGPTTVTGNITLQTETTDKWLTTEEMLSLIHISEPTRPY